MGEVEGSVLKWWKGRQRCHGRQVRNRRQDSDPAIMSDSSLHLQAVGSTSRIDLLGLPRKEEKFTLPCCSIAVAPMQWIHAMDLEQAEPVCLFQHRSGLCCLRITLKKCLYLGKDRRRGKMKKK